MDHDPNHPAPAGSSSSNKAEASSTKDLNALRTRSQNQKPTSDDEKGPLGEKKPEADIFYVLKTKLETVDELFKRLDAVSSSVENVRTSLKKLEQQNSSAAPETTPTSSSTPRNNTSWSSTTTSPEEKSGEDHTASSVNGNDAASAAAEKSGSTATSGVGNMSATGALPTTAQTGDAVTAKKRSSLTKTLEKLQQQQREIWREIRATVTTKFIEDMALMDFDALFDKLMQQLAAPPSCGDGDDGGVDEEDLEELRHIEEVESLGAQIVVPVGFLWEFEDVRGFVFCGFIRFVRRGDWSFRGWDGVEWSFGTNEGRGLLGTRVLCAFGSTSSSRQNDVRKSSPTFVSPGRHARRVAAVEG